MIKMTLDFDCLLSKRIDLKENKNSILKRGIVMTKVLHKYFSCIEGLRRDGRGICEYGETSNEIEGYGFEESKRIASATQYKVFIRDIY